MFELPSRAVFCRVKHPRRRFARTAMSQGSPRDSSRWLFPSLGDIVDATKKKRQFVPEFGVGFPHDKHLDVVGLNRFQ